MPRVPSIYTDFFYEPLTEDVEELLAHFQHTDSVRYEDFSAIWRDLGFSDIFMGINNSSEMKRFSRITLATAMKFFLPPYSYQIRVGGLYLLYAFYQTQLASPTVKIRLALKDWTHVQAFLRDSLKGGHHDVVYIYQKLVVTKAFHYTAMPHVLAFMKQQKHKTSDRCQEFLSRSTVVHELMSSDILDEMASIQSHYEKLKGATKEVSGTFTMIHQDFTSRLTECMSEFITWQQKTLPSEANKDSKTGSDIEEAAEESSSRAKRLSSIKQRSYSNLMGGSKSRRHRNIQMVDELPSRLEQVQRAEASQKKRPVSLRARTRKSLGVTEKRSIQGWHLSAPEEPALK
ncbi:snRNA-activating protein complex subunit 1 [Nothobranchius furzeri]|uniref:snRNA-activating protein complex subunit 1-like n=1 Tax=Nothobranchius furzeri TaxID=105023 RepID=A0A8C6NJF1_NOTFU|nr:snRNA-activating protein complex subunit 1-like [Nothobranchius furzeri]